uniref:Mitochondrial carrier protein n=1 Tax=Neobodo designis TaxID=312471 RepID=A0A7S1MKP9_NEODS|mmetsp:Transcript_41144/g.127061  ORF Transcript_41144/g.127061 Transcript_41144/m.127061 type:complete len:314 (+) Transcript_41144:40-981(+)
MSSVASSSTGANTSAEQRNAGPSPGLLVFRRIIGGTVGGVCQALCSHPFDTIKSRIQAGVASSVSECASSTLKNEGLQGFYKGVIPPMTICGFYNATLFSANQAARNLVRPNDLPPGADLSLPRVALAGIMAGPACCAVVCPVEVVKVRLQLQTKDAAKAEFHGVWDCVKKTVQREGVFALYNGYSALLLSRTIGLPFYFGAYEVTKQAVQGPAAPGQPAAPASSLTALLAGTNAGWAFWTACYPCDFVKTKMQMQPRGTTSFVKVLSDTVKLHGVRRLYSGYGACMLRSAPANASVWFAMENTIAWMGRNGW